MAEYELTQEDKMFVAMWIAERQHFRLDQTANGCEVGVQFDSGTCHWFIRERDSEVVAQKRAAFERYAKKIQQARARQWMKDAEEMEVG